MKTSKKAKHKMGDMPGEYSKFVKIRMLESKKPFKTISTTISTNAIKSFRRDVIKKALKAERQKMQHKKYSDNLI